MISGVVIASVPGNLANAREEVAALPWADVFYSDPAGRLVVTVEADGLDDSIARLEQLQQMPNILSASLAEYRLEEHEM